MSGSAAFATGTTAAPECVSRIDVVADASEAEWDAFVDAHPGATVYHRWRWRTIFEQALNRETLYLTARTDGRTTGVLPIVIFRSLLFGRFGVSLPFVNYGGLCADDDDVCEALLQHAEHAARAANLSYVELRHRTARFPRLPNRQHKVRMALTLSRDPAHAWNRVDRKARNQVRKAEKSGLVARHGGADLLDRFYPVFVRNMRDLGTPGLPHAFFRQMLSAFADTARVFLVEHGNVAVAAAVALIHRDTIEVPWASSLRDYRTSCPNNLLYWRIIEWAIEHELSTLDFGRSTPNGGTYQFKQQWGAQPEPLHWEYALLGRGDLPNLNPSNPKFSMAIAAWKHTPLFITNFVGPYIIRQIP